LRRVGTGLLSRPLDGLRTARPSLLPLRAGLLRVAGLAWLVGFLVILVGCSSRPPPLGVFCGAGEWDIPPAYHGNPWAPGGVGAAAPYVYEPLFVYLASTGQYLPRLGTSFTESPDGRELRVSLRPGSAWHDGKPLSSRDVQCTFYLGALRGLPVWAYLDSVECPDPATVLFRFRKPSPLGRVDALTEPITSPVHLFGQHLPAILELGGAQVAGGGGDAQPLDPELAARLRGVREVLFRFQPARPVGTGPYRIGRVTSAEMSLEAFPQHPETDRLAVRRVRLLRWGSNEVIWSYLLAGQLDAAAPACPPDVASEILRRRPTVRMLTPPDLSDLGVLLNTRRPPFDDLRVRQALARLLDRDLVRRVASPFSETFGGLQVGMGRQIARRWLPAETLASLEPYELDPERASRELEGAGFGRDPQGRWLGPEGPVRLELLAPEGQSDLVLLAETVAAQLEAFGMEIEIRVLKRDLYSARLADGDFDLAASFGGQLGRYGDPTLAMERFFMPGGQLQVASGLPGVLDGLDVGALSAGLRLVRDPLAKKETLGRLGSLAHQELPFLACFEKRLTLFLNDGTRVQGWPAEEDPLWTALPAGAETIYATMLATGRVRPVEAR
jgi:peptide/nickel transport system substrate-binding protein